MQRATKKIHHWTPEEDAKLIELQSQGLKWKSISAEMMKHFNDEYFSYTNCHNHWAWVLQLRVESANKKQIEQNSKQTDIQQNMLVYPDSLQTDTENQIPKMETNWNSFDFNTFHF